MLLSVPSGEPVTRRLTILVALHFERRTHV